jgi:hypothetical protein
MGDSSLQRARGWKATDDTNASVVLPAELGVRSRRLPSASGQFERLVADPQLVAVAVVRRRATVLVERFAEGAGRSNRSQLIRTPSGSSLPFLDY